MIAARMAARIVALGAGFGGLELATMLSDALGADAGVVLIDRADSFVIGFSKKADSKGEGGRVAVFEGQPRMATSRLQGQFAIYLKRSFMRHS